VDRVQRIWRREGLKVPRRINGLGGLETMADVMLVRGIPEHIRSDNGPR
jgi:putative transposase